MNPLSRFLRGPWIWIAAGVVLAAYALYRPEGSAPRDLRTLGGADEILALRDRDDVNVLFVLIDTLRAERLHSYGYERPTSPVIDVVASQGVRFARHLAQSSWTKCSMASLWTGLNPQRSGVTRFDDVIPEEATLPAEILREAGFRTVGIWRNGWVEGYFGFDQGFDSYTRPNFFPLPPEVRRENPQASDRGTDLNIVKTANEFLRGSGDERWFLYVHLMDLHEFTYDPSSAKFGTSSSDIYDNSILFVNQILERLFAMLYERELLHKTLIVIASDHGEAFGERGLEGHARAVYPETTEVPLVISFPFQLRKGVVLNQRTSNVDIWPTVLELLGLPGLGEVDGRSRVPEILAAVRGERAEPIETAAIAHLDTTWGQRVETTAPMISVSEKRFRYVALHDAEGEVASEELFDAEQEGGAELENRLEAEPEVAERLRALARDYAESEPAWSSGGSLELDEMKLDQLRALGYQIP